MVFSGTAEKNLLLVQIFFFLFSSVFHFEESTPNTWQGEKKSERVRPRGSRPISAEPFPGCVSTPVICYNPIRKTQPAWEPPTSICHRHLLHKTGLQEAARIRERCSFCFAPPPSSQRLSFPVRQGQNRRQQKTGRGAEGNLDRATGTGKSR